uniref:Myb-like domain-containing protein n=1 Tax=Guillardia theta TaxID=55529 RepID=A0A7S4K0I1_GUITH
MCNPFCFSPAPSVDDAVADLAMSDNSLLDSFRAYLQDEEAWELSIKSADSLDQVDSSHTSPNQDSHLFFPTCPDRSWTEATCMAPEVEGPVSYAQSLLDSSAASPSVYNSASQSGSSHYASSESQASHHPADVLGQPSQSRNELKTYCHRLEKAIFNSSQWSPDEEARFLEALAMFSDADRRVRPDGRRSVGLGLGVARKISEYIGTRSEGQVRSHAQTHFLRHESKNQ